MWFFRQIWNLYLGLMALVGHTVLILLGIGLCGYATMQQLEELHDTTLDVILFGGGILLVGFSTVRHLVWSFCGLALVWGGLIWGAMHLFYSHHQRPEITWEWIALAAVPPFLLSPYLESQRRIVPELEITLSEPTGRE